MSIDISKVRPGDRVQIANGDWFEVLATNGRGSVTIKNPGREDRARHGHVISRFLITARQPAQPGTVRASMNSRGRVNSELDTPRRPKEQP